MTTPSGEHSSCQGKQGKRLQSDFATARRLFKSIFPCGKTRIVASDPNLTHPQRPILVSKSKMILNTFLGAIDMDWGQHHFVGKLERRNKAAEALRGIFPSFGTWQPHAITMSFIMCTSTSGQQEILGMHNNTCSKRREHFFFSRHQRVRSANEIT